MNQLTKIAKLFVFLFAIFGVIWFGSYIARLSVFYQLFQEEDFLLKEYVTDNNLSGILQTINTTLIINTIFFLGMILSFIGFVLTAKLNMRNNGWLFISSVLIFLTAPFEIYLILIDYKIISIILTETFNAKEVLALVIKRFTILSSFPIVEIFAYAAVLYLFIFQPFKISKKS